MTKLIYLTTGIPPSIRMLSHDWPDLNCPDLAIDQELGLGFFAPVMSDIETPTSNT
jgi:hypothetical protein